MFTIEMLPAADGDCLWIEYGEKDKPYRILIDTGTPGSYEWLRKKIMSLDPDSRRFELFIVSHIDNDHIGGSISFLEDPPPGVQFGDVWFNGFRHLVKANNDDRLGVKQAQELTKSLVDGKQSWNRIFQEGPVMVPDDGSLPTCVLDGAMKLTLLSPYREQLIALLPEWERELDKLREKQPELVDAEDSLGGKIDLRALAESAFEEDLAVANGSSIAILAEHGGHRVLFGADAFPTVIERSVTRLLAESNESRLRLDGFKVCHHGSAHNTSPTLPGKLSARRYLVSTNGVRHQHPHREGIARLLYYGAPESTLFFNYETEFNRVWNDGVLKKQYHYATEYPGPHGSGMLVDLEAASE